MTILHANATANTCKLYCANIRRIFNQRLHVSICQSYANKIHVVVCLHFNYVSIVVFTSPSFPCPCSPLPIISPYVQCRRHRGQLLHAARRICAAVFRRSRGRDAPAARRERHTSSALVELAVNHWPGTFVAEFARTQLRDR